MKAHISFELYVRDVKMTRNLFISVFGAKPGYTADDFAVLWFGNTRMILNALNLDEFQAPNPVLKEGALGHLGAGVEVVLSVEDFDAVREQAERAGLAGLTPVTQQPWGLHDFRFLLEDGYYIRVTEADEDVKAVR